MAVVTLGGLTGGGGRLLGPMVAERLGADYVDRLILTTAAREVGATVEALHQREQRPPTFGEKIRRRVQQILERSAVSGASADPYFGSGALAFLTQEFEDLDQPIITRGHEVEEAAYHQALRKTMGDLASDGNVVIVGRGGSIILRDDPTVLRVGVVAEIEDRIGRIMDRERLNYDQAAKVIENRDSARTLYFKNHFNLENPDDPHLYQLVINSSEMDLEYAAEVVVDARKALDKGYLGRKA